MQLLKDAGCDCAQGYWLAAPMCRDDFKRWTAEYLRTRAAAAPTAMLE